MTRTPPTTLHDQIESLLRKHPAVAEVVVCDGVVHVVPDPAWADPAMLSAWTDKRVSGWQLIWERTYGGLSEGADPTSNLTSWDSSYTGQPIEPVWVEETVARIQTLRPRRVLEIGCGTGLLLFRLAPSCARYVACDFSAGAIEYVERQRSARPDLAHVELRCHPANQLEEIVGPFDTVIINSVAQYFPSLDYLTEVLQKSRQLLGPGGVIFAGDIRSLPMLRVLHASLQAFHAPPTTTREELRQRVRGHLEKEGELVIDPHYFRSWPGGRVLLKRGRTPNELNRFRYDALLPVGTEVAETAAPSISFAAFGSLAALRAHLERERFQPLLVTAIPNARLTGELRLLAWLDGEEPPSTVGELAPASAGIDPEALWSLGGELGLEVELSPAINIGQLDAGFFLPGTAPIKPEPSAAPARLSTHPLLQRLRRQLVPELERLLADAFGTAPPLSLCDVLPGEESALSPPSQPSPRP